MSESASPTPSAFSTHTMQLFESDELLADAVADFCSEGVLRNETVLAVVREERWYSIAERVSARGVALDDALWRGLLTVRSAERMLKGIMRADRPHLPFMTTSIGPLISRLEAFGRPLRIYGEMVDILASRGEHVAALELEELWNVLLSQNKYRLFCGYSAANFADPQTRDELRRICAAHTEVRSDSLDARGSSPVRTPPGG